MVTRDFSGKDVYKVLVNVGSFRHVRTNGDHLILRWEPPDSHEAAETRVVTVPAHDSISIGTLHDIADDAGAQDFVSFCEWIDKHR
ncbi:type II toxin-antitoxin system HicA family toxin [Halonotius roseus]|uniref:Type II toxin-antitoxin system HicA family toxin n=1 Tax=Halonotius roseus TaxID=2511997 RepID=A0A544QQF9_9EURY|nr:type II toxin-antitoxin system HicA family toxin [Halonotius roseus]TQQ81651.1 type II toxin-antitoxin system HicA family toxin [Halonotius roseus]